MHWLITLARRLHSLNLSDKEYIYKMNYITNERGESVVAEGAPGSLARLLCEYPDTWLDHSSVEHKRIFMQSRNPSHLISFWTDEDREGEPTGFIHAWSVGRRQVAGKTEFLYLHWSLPQTYMSYPDLTYFHEELPKFSSA